MEFAQKTTHKIFVKTVLIHMICWILFIAYELVVLYYTAGKLGPFYLYLIFYIQNIGFFYILLSLLNWAFNQPVPRYLKGVFLYFILFFVYLSVKFITEHLLESPSLSLTEQFILFRKFLLNNLSRGFYFTVIATFYWASGHIAYFKKQAADAERQQLLAEKDKAVLENRLKESQNAYLKQQINPHMLFNALNFIYSRVFRSSKKAAQSVLLLSDIMQFSLKEAGADGKVLLLEEIGQIDNLLEINRYRFDFPLNLDVRYEGDFEGRRIIPLILFTLTENLFKHGDLGNVLYPATVHIKVDPEGRLNYFSRNLKCSEAATEQHGPIGLQNVRIRLNYAYPGDYVLTIADAGDFYELNLELTL